MLEGLVELGQRRKLFLLPAAADRAKLHMNDESKKLCKERERKQSRVNILTRFK